MSKSLSLSGNWLREGLLGVRVRRPVLRAWDSIVHYLTDPGLAQPQGEQHSEAWSYGVLRELPPIAQLASDLSHDVELSLGVHLQFGVGVKVSLQNGTA
mmetsp:Transcript_29033/g.38690  ORF Transcript_29033/g.38690 Transcript_29033/m.38690 type:complete len:99 (-) Transcript_29033:217-513(-)